MNFLRFAESTLPGVELTANYDPTLVALSYLVAFFAACTALALSARVYELRQEGRNPLLWLAGGAISMGAGIWSMHFVAMLAYQLPVPVLYDVRTTLVSLMVAIAASAFALFVVTQGALSWSRLILGGIAMGAGVGAMHYIGMEAMRLDALLLYRPWPFALSIVNAVACSTIALWIVFRLKKARIPAKLAAGSVMGAAIAGMHYIGMYATVCIAQGGGSEIASGVNSTGLAIALTAATLSILGVALVLSLQAQRQARKLRERNEMLSIEVERRRVAESALQFHSEQLEHLVALRTVDLAAAKDAAERANAAKSVFLSNMSHELRTPMHAILGFARLGQGKSQEAKLSGYFESIYTSGERLLALLNDLLDLAKMEAGHLSVDARAGQLRPVLEPAIREITPLLASRNLSLSIDEAPDLPPAMMDAPRIDQLARNLLSNAVKFSHPDGHIRIRIFVIEGEEEAPRLVLSVSDEGIGIPESELETIFDKFVQSSKTRSTAGGTGLGLSISREIAHVHGGRIYARNNAAGGAEFIVELPIAAKP